MTAPIGYPEKLGALLPRVEAGNIASTPGSGASSGAIGGALAPDKTATAPSVGTSFAQQLEKLVTSTNDIQRTGQEQSNAFANGQSNDIHGTMIAVEQAEISLRLLSNVRNRMVEMYREVMRMGS